MLRCVLLLIGAGLARAAPPPSGADFFLKDGDRVVFYGNGVPQWPYYAAFVETYVATRFPHLHSSFVSAEVDGDTVAGGQAGSIDLRLRRDVVLESPTVITIMLGEHDAGWVPWNDELFRKYSTGYEHIIESLRSSLPRTRITLIQHSPHDDVTRPPLFEGGYNAVLMRYNQFVKELGRREHLPVVDFNGPVVRALQKAQAADPELARKILPDRRHPGPGAQLVMAEALLKAWNAPVVVAAVEIDAETKRVMRANNAEVTDLRVVSSVTWTEADAALPMRLPAFDAASALVVRGSDFVETLNQEPLRVTGLAAARYSLTIDGEKVGNFTRQQLQAGINLAELPTPMTAQALKVYELAMRHIDVHYRRWIGIQLSMADYNSPNVLAAMDALDKLAGEIRDQERAQAQPKPRQYTLAPQ
ncbi:MAG: SGNH/GDSL hydrolase family protein [Elusimicrobiota bacterium]